MNFKKNLLILFFVIFILLISIFFVILRYLNSNTVNQTKNTISDDELITEINNGYDLSSLPITTINSSVENPIEMNNIEATRIEIINNSGELQVYTTLKNNSNEPINGLFLEIALLDENGNTISNISQNTETFLDINKEITLSNNIVGIAGDVNISNAKIVSIEKNIIQNSIENSINKMQPSIENSVIK